MKSCETCGAPPPLDATGNPALIDYCAECGRDLCADCMAKGHCGHVPARSGMEEDYPDDD